MLQGLRVLALATAALFVAGPPSTEAQADVSLDVKIGQILIVGFRGTELSEEAVILEDIRHRHLGGVVLFNRDLPTNRPGRNVASPQQLLLLVRQLHQAARLPLIVAVDQEGGKVRRLRRAFGIEAESSAAHFGALDQPPATADFAARTARLLSGLGINLNFAPVVDLDVNPDNPVIGKPGRSYGADPRLVVRHASEVIRAHRANDVLSAVKHFPGHGSSRRDSHFGLPNVTHTWSERELVPFSELIGAGLCDAIMTGHIFNAHLDANYPATLSRRTIQGLLRKKLRFDGVVISDDLGMKAIKERWGIKNAIRLAINAGVDILVFANNTDHDERMAEVVIGHIKELLARGAITEQQIETAYRRVQRLKAGLRPVTASAQP